MPKHRPVLIGVHGAAKAAAAPTAKTACWTRLGRSSSRMATTPASSSVIEDVVEPVVESGAVDRLRENRERRQPRDVTGERRAAAKVEREDETEQRKGEPADVPHGEVVVVEQHVVDVVRDHRRRRDELDRVERRAVEGEEGGADAREGVMRRVFPSTGHARSPARRRRALRRLSWRPPAFSRKRGDEASPVSHLRDGPGRGRSPTSWPATSLTAPCRIENNPCRLAGKSQTEGRPCASCLRRSFSSSASARRPRRRWRRRRDQHRRQLQQDLQRQQLLRLG